MDEQRPVLPEEKREVYFIKLVEHLDHDKDREIVIKLCAYIRYIIFYENNMLQITMSEGVRQSLEDYIGKDPYWRLH